jgi:hypothetical protein
MIRVVFHVPLEGGLDRSGGGEARPSRENLVSTTQVVEGAYVPRLDIFVDFVDEEGQPESL